MRIKIAGVMDVEIRGRTCRPAGAPRAADGCPYCLGVRCGAGHCARFGGGLVAADAEGVAFERCAPCRAQDAPEGGP